MVSGPGLAWPSVSREGAERWSLLCFPPAVGLPSLLPLSAPPSPGWVTPVSSVRGQIQRLVQEMQPKCNHKGHRSFLPEACGRSRGQSQASVPGPPSLLGPFSLLWMLFALCEACQDVQCSKPSTTAPLLLFPQTLLPKLPSLQACRMPGDGGPAPSGRLGEPPREQAATKRTFLALCVRTSLIKWLCPRPLHLTSEKPPGATSGGRRKERQAGEPSIGASQGLSST